LKDILSAAAALDAKNALETFAVKPNMLQAAPHQRSLATRDLSVLGSRRGCAAGKG
jgi:hypothetical protein